MPTSKLRNLVASLAVIAVITPAPAQNVPFFRMNAMTAASDSVVVPPMPGGPPNGGNPTNPSGPPPMTGEPPVEPVRDATAAFDLNGYVGKRGLSFSTGLPTTDLPGPVTWTLAPGSTALPAGLAVDPETGVVAGRPTVPAIYQNVRLRAASPAGEAITPPAIFAILNPTLTYSFAGLMEGEAAAIEATLTNTLRPATFEVDPAGTQLPTGLALDPSTGAITGRPATATTVSGLRLRVTGADGAVAEAGPYTFTVAAASLALASEVLPDTVALPQGNYAGESRLNVTYLLGQYVPDSKPVVGVGEAIEIAYAQPVRADGAHLFAIPNANSFRVDALVGGQWQAVRTNMMQVGGNAAPRPFGSSVTASRFRIVNTGSTTWTNVTGGMSYGGNWSQLPVVTTEKRSIELPVGGSLSGNVNVYTGAMGYGTIRFKAPYSYALWDQPFGYLERESIALPAGIGLNPTTGTVSGTATAATWTNSTIGNSGSNIRGHWITVTDQDGYTVFSESRAIVVYSNIDASNVAPSQIVLNGNPVDPATRTALLRGNASINVPAQSTIELRYAVPVYANSSRITYSGDWGNIAMTASMNGGRNRKSLSAVPNGGSGVMTLNFEPTTATEVYYLVNRATTLRGVTAGRGTTFPAP